MTIKDLENYSLSQSFYNLKDKLQMHVYKRSEKCFEKAEKIRESIKDKESLELYTDKMRERFIQKMGGIPYEPSLPLNAKTVKTIEEEALIIENIIFESRPGIYVTATLYMPKKRKEPCGAVLFQCGHADEGRLYTQYQRVARIIAMSGVIVLVQDPTGQGERYMNYESSVGALMTATEHQYFGNQCHLVGDSPMRYFIGDAMRGIDYLESRPEVDKDKIGLTGSSGGGTLTTYMMVCEKRAKAAAPGTFVMNRKSFLYSGSAQDAEQIWLGATEYGFDHNELLMCFAPKPLLILAVDSDAFPIEGTNKVFADCKRFWGMYEAEEMLRMYTDHSVHAYTDMLARQAGRFFAEVLNGEAVYYDGEVQTLPAASLYAAKDGRTVLMPNARSFFDENRERLVTKKREKDAKSWFYERVYKDRKPTDFNVRYPVRTYINGLSVSMLMWFSQEEMPCNGILFTSYQNAEKKLPITVCLWDKGTDDLVNHIWKIRKLCEKEEAVFVLDVSGIGKCTPHDLNGAFDGKSFCGWEMRLNHDLLHLGDSLCAIRSYDLLRAVEMLESIGYNKISIYAEGRASVYARIAGKLKESIPIDTKDEVTPTEIVKTKYYEDYDIYGIVMPTIALYYDEDVYNLK